MQSQYVYGVLQHFFLTTSKNLHKVIQQNLTHSKWIFKFLSNITY